MPNAGPEVADHLCGEAVRYSVEPRKETVFLIEPLPTGAAGIPTLSQVQICMHSMHVQILDSLYTVVVDALCLALTAWADVLLPRQLYLYAAACFIFINIFTITSSNPSSFEVLSFIEHTVSFLVVSRSFILKDIKLKNYEIKQAFRICRMLGFQTMSGLCAVNTNSAMAVFIRCMVLFAGTVTANA